MGTEEKLPLNFIEQIVEKDLETGKNGKRVHTRFPPEPNGYLHIGHAKSICLNFGLAAKYGGKTNLRFDDTNPVTEETEYVESIQNDVRWLGFQWEGEPLYASDYFDQLHAYAVEMIRQGKAYVDDSTPEEIAAMKGTPTQAGTVSPYFLSRSIAENLDLFERMKRGEFPDGSKVLRARIDMASPNMHLRDPILYRIKKAPHHRTGDTWNIYPMYDMAHGYSDSIEGITHSICTLEFEVHRPLYDWLIDQVDIFHPQQIEFARLNVAYMMTSKRKLLQLVREKYVNGWDDPRMPTISGMRRRGYTPASIRNFCERVGVARRENVIDMALLEFCVREDLNKTATRVMAVLDPLRLVITNYPESKSEMMDIENNPEDEAAGSRLVPFSRVLYIEREDFREEPANKKYFRLAPGGMVRLKGAFIVLCDGYDKDEAGNITEVRCTYIPESRSGKDSSGLKVKGTIHWVSAGHALEAEARIYDRLFTDPDPTGHEGVDFLEFYNKDSLTVLPKIFVEPSLLHATMGGQYQFIRKAYFTVDPDSRPGHLVFNQTVTLKDTWAKEASKG
jgi:glutaminyl-tRNA synthetase